MSAPGRTGSWTPSARQRQVRDAVARIFEVEPHALIGRSRRRPVVQYRHTAIWVIRKCFPALTFEMIGQLFGGRDHSTVMAGIRNVDERRRRDRAFAALTDAMRDGFGVQDDGPFPPELRLRVAAICAELADAAEQPVRPPPPPAPRKVLPKNDFAADDSDARKRHHASDALGRAIAREGLVCR